MAGRAWASSGAEERVVEGRPSASSSSRLSSRANLASPPQEHLCKMAAVAPAALTTASGQPVYLPNLAHNSQSLYYVKSTTACIAGAVAGILGLTNLAGFAFFLLSSVSVGGVYALANCGAKPGRYFVKPTEPLLAGTLSNCFSFILFWTLFYSLVYIYD